jgi:hypothetical protein
VHERMPREQRERYNKALWHAVHEKDLRLESAETFGDWWIEHWAAYGDDIDAGFAAWVREPKE